MNEKEISESEKNVQNKSVENSNERREFMKSGGRYAAATTVGLATLMAPGRSSVAASEGGP